MKRYILLLIKYRFVVLAGLFIMTAIFGAIALQGVIASSVANIFFGENHPGYNAYRQRIQDFASDEVFIVIYKDNDLLSEASLKRLESVIGKIENIPEVARVDSLVNAQHIFAEDEILYVNKYVDEAREQPERKQEILDSMATDPLLNGLIVAPDGQHTAVIIELTTDKERPVERGPLIVEEVRMLFKQSGFNDKDIHFVGLMTTLAEVMNQSYFNVSRLFPYVCVVLLLVVYLMFHRLWPVLITLGVALMGVIWTYGFAVMLDRNINIFVALSPAIIIIVATSDVIHLCNAYLLVLSSGKSKRQAILQSGTEVGTACFWTSATTFVGFVSMAFIPVPAFRVMGVILGFGVAVSLLLAMTLTPILFSLLKPPKTRTYEKSWSQIVLGKGLFRVEEYILTIPWRVIVLFVLAFLASILGASQLVIETDFNKRFSENNWVRRDLDYYNNHFAGANFLEVFLDAPEAEGILDPETYARVEAFQQAVEAMPEVDKVASLVDLINTIDRELNPERAEPFSHELLAQYLLLFEMSGGEDLDRFMNFDRRTIRLAVRLAEDGAVFTYDTGNKVQELGKTLLDNAAEVHPTGMTYLMGGFLDDIFLGQRRGILFAFATILVMMIIMFRSWKIGLWSMVPNILPLLALGGYVGYFWEATDSDTIVIAMIAIGIGVDDTIHFLTRLKFESARTDDPVLALQQAFHFCGRAMVTTTIILALGFMPFMLSDYFSVRIFGTLLPYTLIVAVLADILLVPALVKVGFVRFAGKKERKE
jgi:predicted RND superfamily exporter protein